MLISTCTTLRTEDKPDREKPDRCSAKYTVDLNWGE